MKKWMLLLCLPLMLCGCSAEETFETIADEQVLSVMASPRQITVELPEGTAAPVLEREGEQVYLCEAHEIMLETRSAGDLTGTIRSICGYEKEDLTVMETQWQDVTKYEFVWAAAGETGDRLGRAVILDDGQYHYCMSVLRDAQGAHGSADWDRVFASFTLT